MARRSGPHLLWWAAGVTTFAVGTFTEGFVTLFGWNAFLFRSWYIAGAHGHTTSRVKEFILTAWMQEHVMHCHWPWPEEHFRMAKLDGTVATAANKAVEERLVLLMEEELHPLRKKAAYEDAAAKVRKPALRHRQRIESVAVPCHAFHLIQIDRSRG